MATFKSANISNIRHPEIDNLKGLGNVHRYNGIYEAIVVHASDVQKNGRLKVRLVNSNVGVDFLDDDERRDGKSHLNITVQWSSPFAGATNINNNVSTGDPTAPGEEDPDKTFSGTQKSYGMWMIPPDVGNRVLVMFINGDIAKGVVVGCMFQTLMNHMVPGIARSKTFTSDDKFLEVPVAEYNKAADEASNVDWSVDRVKEEGKPVDNVIRPTHTTHFNGLKEQGLEQDEKRGLSDSSARRESPSKVFGILTPDGNQFVMDDGSEQQLIRLRTKSGAQILLDETNGNVYIINKKGTGWIEMDDAGKIDVWANDSISIRSHKDVNIRADRDLNLESGRDINVRTTQTTATGQPTDTTGILPGVNGAFNLDVAGALNIKTVDATTITSGKEFHLQSTSTSLTATQGDTNILTSAGNHVESTPAGVIHMNGPAAASATPYGGLTAKVDDDGNLFFTNTLYTRDASTGNRNTEKVSTILTRFPTREPFAREEFIGS